MKIKTENKINSNKPVGTHHKKDPIQFYSSFGEMNEADAKAMAALSPVEHLQNVVFLIENIFADELKKPMDKTIQFK